MKILEAVGVGRGEVTNEHPKDPGRDPYPSTWNLTEMKRIERRVGMRRVIFPQCLWGQTSRKDTCLSGTVKDLEAFDPHGGGRCFHQSHELLFGLDEEGKFKTRKAQTYPPELCERLARCFVESWKEGRGNPTWENIDQIQEEMEEERRCRVISKQMFEIV